MNAVGKFAFVNCKCCLHIVDMFAVEWKLHNIYHCNCCDRPLVVKGDDGNMYYVGGEIGSEK
jgi:hypothetical protein